MKTKIKFICEITLYWDRTYGNSYHSLTVTRCRDGKQISLPATYGNSSMVESRVLEALIERKWIRGYTIENSWYYLRENDYPIYFVTKTTTRFKDL